MNSSPWRAPIDRSVLQTMLGERAALLRLLDETGSTNADAAQWARDGAVSGSAVVAEEQRAARGRLGRSFSQPRGTGIAVSLIWRPEVPLNRWSWLPLGVSLAVDATLAELGVQARVKWPNDVLVDRRKISGILLERVECADLPAAAVVGVGLNVDLSEAELPVPHATSLRIAGASDLDRTRVLAALVRHLDEFYARWSQGAAEQLREDYLARCDTIGRIVNVSLPDGTTLHGLAEDIDIDGRLVVAGRPVSAGDVTHVRPAS